MAKIEHVTCIKAPVEEVYDYIAHPERNKEWIADVIESEKTTEGPNRVGSRFRFVTRAPMGLHVAAEAEITAMEPPRRLEFRSITGFEHRGSWELDTHNNGCTWVRFRIEYRLNTIESLALRASGMKHFLTRHVEGSVESLKRALENGRYCKPSRDAARSPEAARRPAGSRGC